MNEMNTVIGVNFDPDNLYTDLTLGNATLGIGPELGPGQSIQDLRDYWLNLIEVQTALHVNAAPRPWVCITLYFDYHRHVYSCVDVVHVRARHFYA